MVAVALLAVGWRLVPLRHSTPAQRQPNLLVIEAVDLDFGEVWAQTEVEHTVVVRNASHAPLRIERIVTDCSCTSVAPVAFDLPPGAAREVTVTIDLNRAKGERESETVLRIEAGLTFFVNDHPPQQFSLRGRFASPFAVQNAMRLATPLAFGEPAPAERLTIWKDPRITSVKVQADPADADVREVAGLATVDSATYEVRPNSLRSLGRFGFDLFVSATDDADIEYGPIQVHVSGRMDSDVAWSPEDPLLIWTDAEHPPVEEITFWTRSGGAFSIEIGGAPDFVSAELDERPDGPQGSRTLRLTGASLPASRTYGVVVLNVACGDHRELKLTMPVAVEPLVASSTSDALVGHQSPSGGNR